ncbi:MAG: cytochrome c oxidase subunit II, partial [Acidobacteriota bacterium]|nr:cytochrome c oxidase subunit II [Acidobacteriota bacterium]
MSGITLPTLPTITASLASLTGHFPRGALAAWNPSGSIFSPHGPNAEAITHLFIISLWICAVIFAIVAGLVGYSVYKYRWREGDADPVQLAGNKTVEIVWTVIPFCIVLFLFWMTVRAMDKSDPPATGSPDLVVIGHQWWWEVRYPKNGFATANEIHIPVGKPISVELDTIDVLHEFWVPELTRKMTTVPAAKNHVWMEADKPGVYQGVCS